jgi:hypothetical protein
MFQKSGISTTWWSLEVKRTVAVNASIKNGSIFPLGIPCIDIDSTETMAQGRFQRSIYQSTDMALVAWSVLCTAGCI